MNNLQNISRTSINCLGTLSQSPNFETFDQLRPTKNILNNAATFTSESFIQPVLFSLNGIVTSITGRTKTLDSKLSKVKLLAMKGLPILTQSKKTQSIDVYIGSEKLDKVS
jgi:hypothetical protein